MCLNNNEGNTEQEDLIDITETEFINEIVGDII